MSSIHVFLTRPAGRNGHITERLATLGLTIHELPALAIRPLPRPLVVPLPDDYDAVVFVSREAVHQYLSFLDSRGDGAPQWPLETVAATVGASSAKALRQAGFIPASCILHPSEREPSQDSEALFRILRERDLPLRRVLIVRGTQGRPWLGEALARFGARVDFLPVYERAPAEWTVAMQQSLALGLGHPQKSVFLVTSGEGVHALARGLRDLGLLGPWAQASFVVIHERIAATLQSVLDTDSGQPSPHIEVCTPDDHAIVETIHAVAQRMIRP